MFFRCDGVDLEALFPGQDAKPNGGAHDGIDKQDDQNRMHQSHPVMKVEDLSRHVAGWAGTTLPDGPPSLRQIRPGWTENIQSEIINKCLDQEENLILIQFLSTNFANNFKEDN